MELRLDRYSCGIVILLEGRSPATTWVVVRLLALRSQVNVPVETMVGASEPRNVRSLSIQKQSWATSISRSRTSPPQTTVVHPWN